MIDHVTLPLSNYAERLPEYKAILEACGWKTFASDTEYSGFGPNDRPFLWISEPFEGRPSVIGAHVAVQVDSKEAVQAFHAKALELGWQDYGAPGPRTDYGDNYYGAFVLDPDGNNIEAVTFN